MVKKKKKVCALCNDTGVLMRYYPVFLKGRFILVHNDCATEARNGKYGQDNRRFNINESFAIEEGRL